jgi:hypothetical protein
MILTIMTHPEARQNILRNLDTAYEVVRGVVATMTERSFLILSFIM